MTYNLRTVSIVGLLFLLAAAGLAQWDDNLLKPFVVNHRAGCPSLADVSFLLEAPAGKDGFIRVQGGHLVKPNGQRIRLWGVHLTDWSRGSVELPPKEDAPMWAGTLARFGVNCVRLHFLDLAAPRGIIAAGDDSRHFDAQQLDRLDFMVSELKKRGIYVDLNLNVGRSYKASDGVQDYDKIQWGKGLVMFDARLIEDFGHVSHAPVLMELFPIAADDPSRFLAPVLQRVQTQIGQARRLGMGHDGKNAAFVMKTGFRHSASGLH